MLLCFKSNIEDPKKRGEAFNRYMDFVEEERLRLDAMQRAYFKLVSA